VTEAAFYEDSYQKEIQAKIVAIHDDCLELDRTIFYPLGGGQPGDTGFLINARGMQVAITDTRKDKESGNITHHLTDNTIELSLGETVTLRLDWERRYQHMRMHTGMHLLGSLIPVPVTGGQVGAEKSRLDFDLGDHQLDKEQLSLDMNKLIEAGHAVEFSSITDAELDANPGLVRTMSVQPPRGAGTIRTVRISDIDYQPCGGTHVNNTAEIGRVRISKIENKGKRNRRVHLVWE